jgi:hypothetical protein
MLTKIEAGVKGVSEVPFDSTRAQQLRSLCSQQFKMPFGRRSFGGYGRRSAYYYGGYGGGFGYDFAAELRRDEELERQARLRELQRQAAGSRRRQVELERFGKFVPAGEWDADCEAWPEKFYNWSVGAFKMTIGRGPTHAWNGYVELPEGYPHREKHYDFWNGTSEEGYGSGLPKPPVRELTYGNAESFSGPAPVGKFGFDHSWGQDRQPMVTKPGTAGNHDGCVYTTAEMVINEVWRLAAYFASLVLDGTLPTTAEWMAEHRESLLKIVEQDMRIAAAITAKKRAAAAEAARLARIAAEKAAAEAAERQRIWDEAHPEEAAIREAEGRAHAVLQTLEEWRSAVRELENSAESAAAGIARNKEKAAHAQKKIEEAEALEARRDAGEELLAREKRQINHLPQLRIELKNIQVRIGSHPLNIEAIAIAEAKVAEIQARSAAAQAEVQRLKDAWAAKQKAATDLADAKAEKEENQKRLDRVNQLISQIDTLKAKKEAGETLDPLQAKKIGRRPVLAKEKAELEAAILALNLQICPQAQKTGSRCPGFVLCFTCMSPEEQARAAASQWR